MTTRTKYQVFRIRVSGSWMTLIAQNFYLRHKPSGRSFSWRLNFPLNGIYNLIELNGQFGISIFSHTE